MARAMMNDLAARISRRADLAAVCDAMARAGLPHLPLVRAAAEGRLALCILNAPDAPWPARELADLWRPVVVLVGDDPAPGHGVGPIRWKAAKRLRRWCKWSLVHGAAAEPAHYAAAAEAAAVAGRVVLVETDAANVMAWRRYLGPEGLTILPPPGTEPPARPVLH